MAIDLLSAVMTAATLHWVVNGVPLQATYLSAQGSGCVLATARATAWRKLGNRVVEQKVGQWCVVGTVVDQHWVAEQWSDPAVIGRTFGWRVRFPVANSEISKVLVTSEWPIDVKDAQLDARIRFRTSLDTVEHHHQATLRNLGFANFSTQQPTPGEVGSPKLRVSRLPDGQLVVSGTSAGTQYSVVIQRNAAR